MKEKIMNLNIIKFIKSKELKVLKASKKYYFIFFIGITLFLFFFIFKNIFFIKQEKIFLKQLRTKQEEVELKKKSLEEKVKLMEIEKNKSEKTKKEVLFIYDNSSLFKIDFEKKLRRYNFEYVESSRLEKEKITEDEIFFYEVKTYYEILGKIEEFEKIFFLLEEEFYIIEKENFIIDFDVDEKKLNVKLKVKFFSYEKNRESEKSDLKFEKINKINFKEIKTIKIKNSHYCIIELENKRKKILKKDSIIENLRQEFCK